MFLRAFAGGGDRLLAVNDFAAQSWGRDQDAYGAGNWYWTSDSRFVVQQGVDGTIAAAVRADTGAAVDVPEHTALRGAFEGAYQLSLPDPSGRVEALWSPEDGDLLVLWRDPAHREPRPQWSTDAHVYFSVDTDDPKVRSLWRVERSTGATEEVLPAYGLRLDGPRDDGRLLMMVGGEDDRSDIVLADPATGEVETLAEGTAWNALVVPERGAYYLDFWGPEPGLWRAPIPGE